MRRVRRRSSTLFRPDAGSLDAPSMESIDQILKARVEGETAALHNACYIAMDKEGTLYSKAYGSRDLARSQPIDLDSFHWIASLTKLSTAIATMIAVEKGLVTLDQNVREIVPELEELDVLEGFDEDGTPRLRKCTSPISLRQLLSHSSGFCYDQHHEGLQRWAKYVGKKENTFTGSHNGYLYPLIFEPGQGWSYGSGMDWAGRTIEVVAKEDLETFMKTNIWTPLGMNSTTFRPWARPDLEAKLVELAWRRPDGNLIKGKNPFGPAVDCCGGVGLFSTPQDQAKLLAALLNDGGEIMSKKSLDELMSPQTEDPSHFLSVVCGTKRAHLGQTWPEESKGDFGLSSSINATDFPGRRAANSANWQGMPGVHAWLDRTTGIAGLFTTQLLPPGDKVVTNTFCALEEAVYKVHASRM
ncbi:beta-lactamase family protein [Xylaria sp. FL1042]|nr:beta-lactamase family protein [Xylaria sp. FL1042]